MDRETKIEVTERFLKKRSIRNTAILIVEMQDLIEKLQKLLHNSKYQAKKILEITKRWKD